jgi:hypothetical protein
MTHQTPIGRVETRPIAKKPYSHEGVHHAENRL